MHLIPIHRSSTARFEPAEWRDAGKADPVGTHTFWAERHPTIASQWDREMNAGLELNQVRVVTTVAWFWRCERGHRWRETTYARTKPTARAYGRHGARWQALAGSLAACRRCVLDDYGARYERCGCIDTDLALADKTRTVLPGWCEQCKTIGAALRPGAAVRVNYEPPTSGAEEQVRTMLSRVLPVVDPEEANAVVVRDTTSWGGRWVFPDILIPAGRVAIEYDSPGRYGTAHGTGSIDVEKDAALAAVGWDVIRIRTGGLNATGRWDVIASGPTHKAVDSVIANYQALRADRHESDYK